MISKLRALALAGFAALMAAPAIADNYVAAGRDGWGYDRRSEAFVEQMRGGYSVANFAGSEDIARAVCGNSGTVSASVDGTMTDVEAADVVMGIAQIDAMLQLSREGCTLAPLGTYPAQEYGFILFPPDGFNELDDFREGARILVGEPGSGSALFWRTIQWVETEHGNASNWSQATPVYGPFALANTQASMGQIDAVIMVTSPDADIIQTLLGQGWTLGELDDRHLDNFEFGRGPLYERGTIEIDHPNRWRNVSQDALVVRSYWIGNSGFFGNDPAALARFASIIGAIQ